MKKGLFVILLLVAAMAVNAQQDTIKTTKAKSTTTTVINQQAVRTAVKAAEILKPITDNVAKDFSGYTIKEATSVNLNNTITYEVVIVKGMTTETLVYDKDGNFLKKIEL